MGPSYRVLTFDLTAARSRQSVPQVTVGSGYTAVKVLACPAGAGVLLAFGNNAEDVPAENGRSFEWVDQCGNPYPCTEGLLVTNPAGAGSLVLLVSFQTLTSVGG